MFLFVAVCALALSFALPIRLSFTKSHRFAGVTPSGQGRRRDAGRYGRTS
jgi:hypothetical protein